MAQIEVTTEGAVMVVTLNRPKRFNAMTLTMFALLADVWQEVSDNDNIRCAILTGAEGNFCSGMDLLIYRSIKQSIDRSTNQEDIDWLD